MNISHTIFSFIILVSLILVIARIFSGIGNKYFGFPDVVGELITGVVISPYLLGSAAILGFTLIPHVQSGMLAPVSGTNPIPQALYMFSQIGAIFLLFNVGLETDPEKFLISSKVSLSIAIGGVVLPFILGYFFILWYDGNMVSALFMGAILTATSIGVTVRVLKDIGKLNSREGVTILVAAVIDDVIGIIILAIVAGIAFHRTSAIAIVFTIVKIIVFWSVIVFIGLKFHRQISKVLGLFKRTTTQFAIILMFLFLVSVLSSTLGMTIIIGAYAFGLALSRISMKEQILRDLEGLYNFFVPIFFVTMGMMVNLTSLTAGIIITVVILIGAIIGKVFGAAIPAMIGKFSVKEALRIGTGMLPRGEVALIIAGYAIVYGLISQEIYTIAIVVTIITTLLAPVMLAKQFKFHRSITVRKLEQ